MVVEGEFHNSSVVGDPENVFPLGNGYDENGSKRLLKLMSSTG